MIVYGIMDCPDCREALAILDQKNIQYEFRALGDKVSWLKEFLRIRDTLDVFSPAKAGGYIGIPAFVFADGTIKLDLAEALAKETK